MPRVNLVGKARKPQVCGSCGKKINAGQPYKWAKPQYGVKMVRCASCDFRPSDLTSSKMGSIYDAQEDFDISGCEDLEGVRSACSDFAEIVREVGQEYRESAENIESGFGHRTEKCDELEEKADELEAWADECESAADGIDDFDEETAKSEIEAEAKIDDDKDELLKERRDQWLEQALEEVNSAIQECPS